MLNDIDIEDVRDSIYTMRGQLRDTGRYVENMSYNNHITAVDMYAHIQAMKIDRIAEKLDGINNTLERLTNTLDMIVFNTSLVKSR